MHFAGLFLHFGNGVIILLSGTGIFPENVVKKKKKNNQSNKQGKNFLFFWEKERLKGEGLGRD